MLLPSNPKPPVSIAACDPHGENAGDIGYLYKALTCKPEHVFGLQNEIPKQPSLGAWQPDCPIDLFEKQLNRLLAGLSPGMTEEEIAARADVRRSMVKASRCVRQLLTTITFVGNLSA